MSYNKNLFGAASIILGAFLIVEHIFKWGRLDFFDFIGHEWLGFILILFGVILNINWNKGRLSIEIKKFFKRK